ncbi:MAG: acetyl-CoA carboxylase biotin carboxylase subunit [Betaproteobacteria bacterium]|nr:acetyl-CoA carboxylase biotin carboxylase subunit [Betaproteobacteria bacterium]
MKPLRRILIANRGEIAVRILRACRKLGIEAYVVVSEADRDSLAARLADRAICIGPPPSRDSYLDVNKVVHVAMAAGCDALHPGYGFLSERAELPEACAANGIVFIGPQADSMRLMGNKLAARQFAEECGVPVLPGSTRVESEEHAAALAGEVGFPVLLKAAAGGGGRGMKVARDHAELKTAFQTGSAEAQAAFGDATLYMEHYIANARHIEVQILADHHGRVLHLGERECSVQRRFQKIIEEAPAALLPQALRTEICTSAVMLAAAANYRNAGTVEYIVDQDAGKFYFLEVNTRLQVEHPVTEMVTGLDIVCEQIGIASGAPLGLTQADVRIAGHAIEVRVNAESPEQGFRPSPGRLTRWDEPRGAGVRVDTHCGVGYLVPPFYDSMIGKLIVHGADRAAAVAALERAVAEFAVEGVHTTLPFLGRLLRNPDFVAGNINTRWAEKVLAAEQDTGRAA